MRKILHNPDLQKEFLKTGYAKVGMLTEEQVAYILNKVKDLRPHDNFTPDQQGVVKCSYHCSFLDTNLEYRRQTHGLIKDIFEPFVNQYLHGYRILNCNFYVKPAGTGEFAIHQNWPAISDINDTTITIWCPLVNVDRFNGTLQVVEGSHKLLPHIETPTAPAYFTNFKEALISKYLKPIPMQAGEALIFDDSLIHWSQTNESSFPRIAIQILCIPEDATPTFFFKLNEEMFEMIHADYDFFLNYCISDLFVRQPEWHGLGFLKSQNSLITESQFAQLLSQGDQIREKIYQI